MFRLRSCTRAERSYISRQGIAAFSSCPVMQNHSMLHMSTSRCVSGCIELPSCQIAVGSATLCPYGVHIHVQIEVLHTRRTLLHLASRHCSVFIPSCRTIRGCTCRQVDALQGALSCHRAKLLSVLLHYAPTGYIFMFRLRSCTRVERSYTSRQGAAVWSCPVAMISRDAHLQCKHAPLTFPVVQLR